MMSGTGFDLQPDGKILVIGKSQSMKTGKNVITVSRFDTNGQVDGGFGKNGIIRIDELPVREQAFIEMQADGKIIVAGTASDNSNFSIARIESGYFPANKVDGRN